MRAFLLTSAFFLVAGTAGAKLPAPSDDAKAKAAEAAAKTAHTAKVADYQLCKSMDAVAAAYADDMKKAGKTMQPVATPACADPGPFVYTPPPAPPVQPVEGSGAHSPPKTASTPPASAEPSASAASK